MYVCITLYIECSIVQVLYIVKTTQRERGERGDKRRGQEKGERGERGDKRRVRGTIRTHVKRVTSALTVGRQRQRTDRSINPPIVRSCVLQIHRHGDNTVLIHRPIQ